MVFLAQKGFFFSFLLPLKAFPPSLPEQMFRLKPSQTSKQSGHQPYALMTEKARMLFVGKGLFFFFFFFFPLLFPLSHNRSLNKISLW